MSRPSPLRLAAVALALAGAAPPPAVPDPHPGYADLVDLTLGAPVIARVGITRADRLRAEDAPGLKPGTVRLYVEAAVSELIRGAGGLPASVSYLVDLPVDAHGRPPRIKGADALLFATRAPGEPGALRLLAPDAELPWTPGTAAVVRATLTQALGPDAPPRIVGIGGAFHVAGTLPGESETQIFLRTADGRPVSLSVSRHPNEQPRWAVALGDMVDDAAAPPPRDSLLWYQLACALPPTLPDASIAKLDPADADAARADYRVVLAGLGPCGRTGAQVAAPASSVTPTDAQSG